MGIRTRVCGAQRQKPACTRTRTRETSKSGWPATIVIFLALIGLWWLLSNFYPPYILPSPGSVIARLIAEVAKGPLLEHLAVTAGESLLGLLLGASLALPFGYLLARSDWLEKAVSPYLVAAQAIPTVALAPLIIIWFGFGLISKVLVASMVAFFPICMNMIAGMRRVGRNQYDLMRIFGASTWQIFAKLELPTALPVLLTGLRMGMAFSVIGAVVGEFASSDRGLGYLVNVSAGMMDTALMFVALITLAILGISFHLLFRLVEYLLRGRF
ncbi:MAG TPA: ABC transporter permease [Firmicutes bacterium]|nr:ABC transporter permease [Bacillota bacterium]HAZ23180.1 ABC transporter permease [Bacillota bacterium]HBG43946.1 ABC transporter permease [Bacillota bacterium]HBR25003.1 ABC transporter permease [Bacillota bacterium]HCX70858.1 ABC transporter permease [Bacillota bacterium]